jgi:F420H(2)-dependent biliverdin reductase
VTEHDDPVRHRLSADRNCWLATVRPDGRVHVAPVWFVFVDEVFWVCTGASSVKARNLAANPAVAVNLEDGNAPVVAEGIAVVVPAPYDEAVIGAFRSKYDWDITTADDPDLGELALVRIDVHRWLMGAPGALRAP